MTRLRAREALTIFVGGEEVPGLIIYELFEPGSAKAVEFPSNTGMASHASNEYRLYGDHWEVVLWEVAITRWFTGKRWQTAMGLTLEAMIKRGARVAWVGAEGVPFCDPPELFSPDCMSGGVLAWMSDTGVSDLSLDPDGPLNPMSDIVMRELRLSARGLADAN